MSHTFSVGLDFGTNSVRALVVDLTDGKEVASGVSEYASGEQGVILDSKDPLLARQDADDYIKSLKEAIAIAIRGAHRSPEFELDRIVGVGVDTTGSTPIPVDKNLHPLSRQMQDNPDAHAWLWKDHTSFAEAEEITELARRRGEPYLSTCGGTYSSEWFWSKALRCARVSPDVFAKAHSWIEFQDYVPAWLCGLSDPTSAPRGICAAGHKAMYSESWGGLPSKDFLGELHPQLASLRDRLYDKAIAADQVAGHIVAECGLPVGTPVAVGAMDAHLGAVGSGVRPGTLVKIMGTSTCDILVGDASVPAMNGVCGIVPGSVIPGMVGIEAGQSAVGDLFQWCVTNLGTDQHETLESNAAKLRPGESGLLALDWNNGNRTVLVDPMLSGLLVGQTLRTTQFEIYRALIEATAFGARKIIEHIESHGVSIEEIVVCGGIAEKSPLVMQIYADICDRPLKLSRSAQTCALGASICGAVAGGAIPSVLEGIERLTGSKETVYTPRTEATRIYDQLYDLYKALHDSFGVEGTRADLYPVMKRLAKLRMSVALT